MSLAIPCPFPVGWVKRQRNPTHLLGFMLQPNLQIKAFSNLEKVLFRPESVNLVPSQFQRGNCRFKAAKTGQGADVCKFSGLFQVKGAF